MGDTRDFVVADDTANRFVERVALVPSASGGWEVWATGEPWEIPLSPNPFEPVSSLEGENMALRTSSILKQALSDELEWQPLLSGGRTTVWFDQDGSTERFQDWISLERWAEPHPQRGTTDIVYVDTADNALAIVHPVPGGGATMQIVQFTGRDKLADAVKTLVPKALSLDDLAGKRDVSLHDIIEASHAKKEPNPFAPKEKASDLER